MASLYQRLGGSDACRRIVAAFYASVPTDPVLSRLYPGDLGAAEERLALFLVQWTGGPEEYQARRGHPRLRLRHLPFVIGRAERDAWMAQMSAAVAAEVADPNAASELLGAFAKTADFLVNAAGLSLRGAPEVAGDAGA